MAEVGGYACDHVIHQFHRRLALALGFYCGYSERSQRHGRRGYRGTDVGVSKAGGTAPSVVGRPAA